MRACCTGLKTKSLVFANVTIPCCCSLGVSKVEPFGQNCVNLVLILLCLGAILSFFWNRAQTIPVNEWFLILSSTVVWGHTSKVISDVATHALQTWHEKKISSILELQISKQLFIKLKFWNDFDYFSTLNVVLLSGSFIGHGFILVIDLAARCNASYLLTNLVKIHDFVKKNCIFGAILTFLERCLQKSSSENPMTKFENGLWKP